MKTAIKTIFTKTSQAGFTLVEMLIYMGLLSFFLLLLSNIFITVVQTKAESEARLAIDQDSKFLLARLEYDISRASDVTAPVAIGQSASTLSLTIGGQAYTYSLSNNQVVLNTPLGSEIITTTQSDVTNLTFTRVGNQSAANRRDQIRIAVTIESDADIAKGKESRSWQKTVGTR